MDDVNYLSLYTAPNYKELLCEHYASLNLKKGPIINKKVMRWIGYIYRATSYILEIPSAQLYRLMSYQKLVKLYYVYHTYGIDYCVEKLDAFFDLKNACKIDEKTVEKKIFKKLLASLNK